MQMQTFRRADGITARVATTGAMEYDVAVWDRGGFCFHEVYGDCEPRSAAAQAIALYDEYHDVRPGPYGPTGFELIEREAAA